jgi:predicted nucleic acid-binding protein
VIYLDACILIYACEDHPAYGAAVRAALASRAGQSFALFALTRMGCLVKPMRTGNLALQRHYEAFFERFVWLPVDDEVFAQATQLRARHGLKTPNALHLACAQLHGCIELWTNDDRLAQAGHGLAVNLLRSSAAS